MPGQDRLGGVDGPGGIGRLLGRRLSCQAALPPSGVYLVEDRRVDGAAAPQPPDVGVYRFFQGRLSALFVPPLSARPAGHKEKCFRRHLNLQHQ